MAQIVTITNPLTGQPAQVDQLEHTAQEIDDGIGFESTDYPGCYYRMVDGVVEWFNPPMQVGGIDADGNPINEYRTTERYQGQPVYVRVYDCGYFPNNGAEKHVSLNITNLKDIVRFSGTMETAGLPFMESASNTLLGRCVDVVGAASGNPSIRLHCSESDAGTYYKAIVSVYYTKSAN